MAWEENKHPRDEDGKFTSKGNEGSNDKTQLIEQVVNKMTNGGTKEVNLNAGTIARASNGQLTEEEVHKWFEDNDELEDYEAFDDDNDFENWEDDSFQQIVSDAQDELGINALDSYENYEQVCDWLIANEYAEDYNAADKMIKDSLSPEGWEKLNKIREEWGIEDLEDNFDLGEDFVENVDNIDYDKVDKNELINKNKAKNPKRKDNYGNELISDEAFKIGAAGANKYLDFMKQYYDYDKLKQSNIFLEGLQNAVSKAITENGYDPNSDMTYQDFNEIIGSALGDEIDIERNKFTGKKYNGYKPKGL